MVDLTLASRGGQARLGIFVSLVGKMLADDVQTFVLIYLPLLLGGILIDPAVRAGLLA